MWNNFFSKNSKWHFNQNGTNDLQTKLEHLKKLVKKNRHF
jgi:hypothetical protein